MFRNTERFCRQKVHQYSLSIDVDEDGYIDKECPKCKKKFKVFSDDWCNLFSDCIVFCPFCNHSTKSDEWYTTEQVKQARENAVKQFEYELLAVLDSDARAFNRSQSKNSFISLSMKVTGEADTSFRLPITALKSMEQHLQCQNCRSRYAVIGASFFCPCCGNRPISQMFAVNMKAIKDRLTNLDIIQSSIPDKDAAATICQSLLESSIVDIVSSLQVISEEVYSKLPNCEPFGGTLFQNMDKADLRWHKIAQVGYDTWLLPYERKKLLMCFQQRHLLQHNAGVIDEPYLKNTNDLGYELGQRLIVTYADIQEYVRLATKAANGMLLLLRD